MFLVMLDNGKCYSDFTAIPVVVVRTQEALNAAKAKVQAYLDLLNREYVDEYGGLDLEKCKWIVENLPEPPYSIDKAFFEFTEPSRCGINVREVPEA